MILSTTVKSCLELQGLYLLAMGQTKAGLAVGTTTSAALLLLDIKRAYDVGEIPCQPKAHCSHAISLQKSISSCQRYV